MAGLPATAINIERAACRPFVIFRFPTKLMAATLDGQSISSWCDCEPDVNLVPASFSFLIDGTLSPTAGPARLRLFRMAGTSGPSQCLHH